MLSSVSVRSVSNDDVQIERLVHKPCKSAQEEVVQKNCEDLAQSFVIVTLHAHHEHQLAQCDCQRKVLVNRRCFCRSFQVHQHYKGAEARQNRNATANVRRYGHVDWPHDRLSPLQNTTHILKIQLTERKETKNVSKKSEHEVWEEKIKKNATSLTV